MVQGSSSFITSTQLWSIFHVLAKMEAVPSISPLVVLKSSDTTSLKSPQSPGWRSRSTLAAMFFTLRFKQKPNHTSECSLSGVAGFNVELHHRRELNLQIDPVVSVDNDEERGWLEHYGVICGRGGNVSNLNKRPSTSRDLISLSSSLEKDPPRIIGSVEGCLLYRTCPLDFIAMV